MKYLKLFENKRDKTVDASKEDGKEVNYENKLLQTIKKDVDSLIDNINQAVETGDTNLITDALNESIYSTDELISELGDTYMNDLRKHIESFPLTERIGGAILDFIENTEKLDAVDHLYIIIWDEILDRFDYKRIIKMFSDDPTTYKELHGVSKNSEFLNELFKRIDEKLPDWVKRSTKSNLWDLKK
jgi:hypothetical protein